MSSYLTDTNVLLRVADPASKQHAVATQAVTRLLDLTPQNFIEFWSVATRPVEANGFGWTSERTAKEVTDLQGRFPVLPDSPDVFVRWLGLVKQLPVHGKRVHDARLVAVLQAHAVDHLITFNTSDFAVSSFLSLTDPHSLLNRPRG